jgi:hypothetical protein
MAQTKEMELTMDLTVQWGLAIVKEQDGYDDDGLSERPWGL